MRSPSKKQAQKADIGYVIGFDGNKVTDFNRHMRKATLVIFCAQRTWKVSRFRLLMPNMALLRSSFSTRSISAEPSSLLPFSKPTTTCACTESSTQQPLSCLHSSQRSTTSLLFAGPPKLLANSCRVKPPAAHDLGVQRERWV